MSNQSVTSTRRGKVDDAMTQQIKWFHDMGVPAAVIARKHLNGKISTKTARQVILKNGWDHNRWHWGERRNEQTSTTKSWTCPTCKVTNSSTKAVCRCGELSPLYADDPLPPFGSSWTCPTCDGLNEPFEQVCSNCGDTVGLSRNIGSEIESYKPSSSVSNNKGLGSTLGVSLSKKILNGGNFYTGNNYAFMVGSKQLQKRVNAPEDRRLSDTLIELNKLLMQTGLYVHVPGATPQRDLLVGSTAGTICRLFFNLINEKACFLFYLFTFRPKSLAASALCLSLKECWSEEKFEKFVWQPCKTCENILSRTVGCSSCGGRGVRKRFAFDERGVAAMEKSSWYAEIKQSFYLVQTSGKLP